MKLISVKCPDCGARLDFEEGRSVYYCKYCGGKILLDEADTVEKHVYVDEARIRESEVKEKIRLKELELEMDKRNEEKKNKALKIKATIISLIIGCILMFIGDTIKGADILSFIGGMILAVNGLAWLFVLVKYSEQ